MLAAQKFDLNQAHGVHIGIAQADRAGEDAVSGQQFTLSGDPQNHLASAEKFLFQHGEDALS